MNSNTLGSYATNIIMITRSTMQVAKAIARGLRSARMEEYRWPEVEVGGELVDVVVVVEHLSRQPTRGHGVVVLLRL